MEKDIILPLDMSMPFYTIFSLILSSFGTLNCFCLYYFLFFFSHYPYRSISTLSSSLHYLLYIWCLLIFQHNFLSICRLLADQHFDIHSVICLKLKVNIIDSQMTLVPSFLSLWYLVLLNIFKSKIEAWLISKRNLT